MRQCTHTSPCIPVSKGLVIVRKGLMRDWGTHVNVVGIDVVCGVWVLRCGQDHPGVVICGRGGG